MDRWAVQLSFFFQVHKNSSSQVLHLPSKVVREQKVFVPTQQNFLLYHSVMRWLFVLQVLWPVVLQVWKLYFSDHIPTTHAVVFHSTMSEYLLQSEQLHARDLPSIPDS